MRFSLREFLVVAGAVSVGVASLIFATDLIAGLWMGIVFLVMVAIAIRLTVLRHRPEPFQVGFLIVALAYTAVLTSLWYRHHPDQDRRNQEFEPWSGWLPTTHAMRQPFLWTQESRSYYRDLQGNRFSTIPNGYVEVSSLSGGSRVVATPGAKQVIRHAHPQMEQFMKVAHSLWTLLLGYLGGKYAEWVYMRGRQVAEAASDSH